MWELGIGGFRLVVDNNWYFWILGVDVDFYYRFNEIEDGKDISLIIMDEIILSRKCRYIFL